MPLYKFAIMSCPTQIGTLLPAIHPLRSTVYSHFSSWSPKFVHPRNFVVGGIGKTVSLFSVTPGLDSAERMMALHWSLTFLVFLPYVAQCYGTGAPCVAQHNLQPSLIFHGTTQNLLTNPPPYAFVVELDGKPVKTYVVGKVHTSKRVISD